MNTEIIINVDEEITNYLTDKDLLEYIQWKYQSIESEYLLKKMKQVIFDKDELDIVLYDLDLTYMQLLRTLIRIFPNLLTPVIVKNLRLKYDELKDIGKDE